MRAGIRWTSGMPLLLWSCLVLVVGCAGTPREDARFEAAAAAEAADAAMVYDAAAIAFDAGDLDGAATAMTEFVARWPELLDFVPIELLYPVALRGDAFTPQRIGFMQALLDANWDGGDAAAGAVWKQLATARLLAGDTASARSLLRRVDDPAAMVEIRGDRRFDGLYDANDWSARVERAARRQADRLRLRAASREDPLPAQVQLGYALMELGEFDAVLALADDALARAGLPGEASLVAGDSRQPREVLWMLNHRADALIARGHLDEAVRVLRAASRAQEGATPNISQRLNLGNLLCRIGRIDEAAAEVDVGDVNITGFGRAVRASVRLCIAQARGDADAAGAALRDIAAESADAKLLHMLALVSVGRDDEGVQVARAMLDSPVDRPLVIHWAQAYRELPPLPGEQAVVARVQAFRQREDLRAAIETVGRIETYPLYRGVR